MAASAHVATVRSLYKRILVLHRFLPIDLKALGDQYVKDEFRRHKSASAEEVKRFMTEWQVNDGVHAHNVGVLVQRYITSLLLFVGWHLNGSSTIPRVLCVCLCVVVMPPVTVKCSVSVS